MKAISDALLLEDTGSPPRRGAILIEGGRIAGIAHGDDMAALLARAADIHDAGGALAIPAFVNAHHHAYGNVLRGTENDMPLEIWALFTVAWGRALDERLLRLAILLGAAEMLRGGIAAVIDHSPPLRLAPAALAAHRESGMRVRLAPMLHDRHDHDLLGFDMPAGLRAGVEGRGFVPIDEAEAIYRDLGVAADRKVGILIGPNAPQRCSPTLLEAVIRLRDRLGVGVHTHLLETRAQRVIADRWPGGFLATLDRAGLLAPGLSVAHGVWARAEERELLARRGVVTIHNPSSNLALGSGVLDWIDCRRHGTTLALGSDSANTGGRADPFELMRLAMSLPRREGGDWKKWPGPEDVFAAATDGGRAALGLPAPGAVLRVGQDADLALVDLVGPGREAIGPGLGTLVRHGEPAAVRATMVDGRWAWRDGAIHAFDEAAVRREFADRAQELVARAAGERATARAAAAHFGPMLADLHARHPC